MALVRALASRQETLGSESERIRPPPRVAMDAPDVEVDPRAVRDLVTSQLRTNKSPLWWGHESTLAPRLLPA